MKEKRIGVMRSSTRESCEEKMVVQCDSKFECWLLSRFTDFERGMQRLTRFGFGLESREKPRRPQILLSLGRSRTASSAENNADWPLLSGESSWLLTNDHVISQVLDVTVALNLLPQRTTIITYYYHNVQPEFYGASI